MTRSIFLILCLLNATAANAKWQCPAIDKFGKFYVVQSTYIKMAVHKSLDRCKKKSTDPSSCFVERAFCNKIEINNVAKSYWQCYAFNDAHEKFRSGPYTDKYEASYAAENICHRLSKAPSTCYVPLFTCEKV